MRPPADVIFKIKNAIRIDRAILFVWRASAKWTLVNAVLVMLQGIIPLISLYLMKLIVDTIVLSVQMNSSDGTISRLVFLVGAIAAVALVQEGITRLAAYSAEAQSSIVTDYVYDVLHKKSIDLDLAYYENPQYYDTLHRAQSEGPYRPTSIVNGLTQLGQNGASLAVMVGLLFTFHWSVGVLLFISTLPGLFVQVLFARKNFRWKKEITPVERQADYYSWILTGYHFAKEVRLFNLGPFFSDSFNLLRSRVRGEKLSLSRQRAVADFLAQTLAIVVLIGCFLLIGIRTIKGYITIGDMVMYFQAFQRGLGNLKSLLQSLSGLYEDNLFVSHFFAFLDAPKQIVEASSTLSLPGGNEEGFELNNVEFSYPGTEDTVLKNVSFKINPEEVVALVGSNGAGKSTLVKLLCRLYDPSQGSISIEKIDYRDLSTTDLRRQISVVFQDYVSYYLTARENIWIGDIRKEIADEGIEQAARKAGVHSLIASLTDGYDTRLGRWFESGKELSHGEWQKLIIARAFYRNASLVILDEPSSSLDADTEYQLFMNFKELISGRSALIISHRFSTVKMADRILVLENGTIIENGSHNQLMQQQGRYAEMYQKQFAAHSPEFLLDSLRQKNI